jgi:OOP family OmpA-OmpF porin
MGIHRVRKQFRFELKVVYKNSGVEIMKRLSLLAAAVVAGAIAGNAAAQSARPAAQPQPFKPFYIGGGAGWAKLDLETADFPNSGTIDLGGTVGTVAFTSTRDEDSFGWKAFAGWRYNQYLAIEGGYVDLGRANLQYTVPGLTGQADLKVTDHAWTLAAVGSFPVGYNVSLLGKLGVALHYTKTSANVSVPGASAGASESDHRAGFLWGVGAAYDFNPNFGMRVEYENFGTAGESDNTGRMSTRLVSGSAIVRF